MRKTTYITPIVEVYAFSVQNIIAASLEMKDNLTKDEQDDVDYSDKSNRRSISDEIWDYMDE